MSDMLNYLRDQGTHQMAGGDGELMVRLCDRLGAGETISRRDASRLLGIDGPALFEPGASEMVGLAEVTAAYERGRW